MKRLLYLLKDYKVEAFLAPLFKLLEALLELFVPLVMARIIDEGIVAKDQTGILHNGILLLILAVVGLGFSVTAQYFAAKAAVGFGTGLRAALFRNLESLSFRDLDGLGSSTMITRLTSDINQVQSGVNLVLRLFLRSPFIVFGAMIMAFTVNVKAALVFVVTIPLLSIVVFGVMLISIPLYKKVQSALDTILLRTKENLSGVRVIRAFAKEDEEKAQFTEENQILVRLQLFVGRISALMNPITYIMINVAVIIIIWIGCGEVYAGVLTQGEVVALVSYMTSILVELVKLANLIININKSLACANRIAELTEMQSSMKEGVVTEPDLESVTRSDIAVEFCDVSMQYDKGAEPALEHLNLTVKRGQTIGIIGGTGSGKSTLVNLIPRFYDISEGSLKVDGVEVSDYTYQALRSKIGCVMQKAVLFSGTIRENLLWGNENASDEELQKAIEIAQASDVVADKGLDGRIVEGGKNLSGGQRQRLTIARALVRNPEILILDDSASALDFATDAALRKAIRKSSQNRTVFIVSQRTSSIFNADLIVVLDDGKVAGIGTHDELLQTCEVYKEIHMSQFQKEGE
ncbi:MAG: ABC transporter ATP-binding protein [Lachnospiraceae bacterium]|nr:ABC transporter ATP-binding protein [Lachnospiraceae bacterium]